MAPDIDSGYTPYTLTVDDVLRVLWRGLLPVTAATLGVHLLVWGLPALDPSAWVAGGLWLLLAYVIAVVAHEALHVLPMFAFGIRWSDLRFGIRWRDGVVFVHGGKPVSARAYRIILSTPGIVLGVLPALYGIGTGAGWITLFGWLMLVSAVGDWAVLRLIRRLPPDTPVTDHPSEVGCLVATPPEIPHG